MQIVVPPLRRLGLEIRLQMESCVAGAPALILIVQKQKILIDSLPSRP